MGFLNDLFGYVFVKTFSILVIFGLCVMAFGWFPAFFGFVLWGSLSVKSLLGFFGMLVAISFWKNRIVM